MADQSPVEDSLVAAWHRMLGHQDVAPSLKQSAQEVSQLLEPLLEYLESFIPDAEVDCVFPGIVAVGGPDSTLGTGASVKMKSLEPLTGGLFGAVRDGTYILVTELGPLAVRGELVRGKNLFTAKVLFVKTPSVEILYTEDGEDDVLRFIFDDLPRSLVETEIMSRA
jgi:hypothetical protein